MKKITTALFLLCAVLLQAQSAKNTAPGDRPRAAYQVGEFLRYRLHYGFLSAGFAELSLETARLEGKTYLRAKGYGYSTGLVRLFFKVKDRYETYIDPQTQWPRRFIRNIQEGGYTQHKVIDFDQDAQTARVRDLKKNRTQTYSLPTQVQDMLSALYFLRNIPPDRLVTGAELDADLFFDNQHFAFELKVLEAAQVKTPFGRIRCLKVQPRVQHGRVFKDQKGVFIWVTQDKNHIPVRIEAQLTVGKLRADLIHFKNLKYPLVFSD